MNNSSNGRDRTPPPVYDLLARHLQQLVRVESVLLGTKVDGDTHTESWLKTVLDDHDASAFIAHGSAQLFSSLIIFIVAESLVLGRRITDDQLGQTVEAAAYFADVFPEDIRKLLLPARLSFKKRQR